jgi:hypothetical protein
MIQVHLLKRKKKEMKVGPKFDGQWNVPSLVANGRFQAWWLMEGSKLGGQWKVTKNTFSPLPIFPSTTFT